MTTGDGLVTGAFVIAASLLLLGAVVIDRADRASAWPWLLVLFAFGDFFFLYHHLGLS